MEIVDTHTHLDMPNFKDEIEIVLARAKEAQVVQMVNVGFNLASSFRSIALARNNNEVFASIGIHPNEARNWDKETEGRIREFGIEDKVVAIGEIGLDYFRNLSDQDTQKRIFRCQIKIAIEIGKPIIIHNREADGEIMRIIEEFNPKNVLLHCFSGDMILAKWAFKRNYNLSFGGSLTYPRNAWLKGIAEQAPANLIMVETDCPYLTPVPLRGKRNEPAYVRHILINLANIRKTTTEEIARVTTENARRFFGF